MCTQIELSFYENDRKWGKHRFAKINHPAKQELCNTIMFTKQHREAEALPQAHKTE
jgi:hypothetical protein